MTARQWFLRGLETLKAAGDPDARYDLRLFLSKALHCELYELGLKLSDELSQATLNELDSMLQRRASGEPEQYIEGCAYFMGLPFAVDGRVLIPRQDSETLCEVALNAIKDIPNARVLDLCTGSGCLAVSIVHRRPDCKVVASDISPDALKVASQNAVLNHAKVSFVCSDGFDSISPQPGFHLIVCNPPYLSREDMNALQREVAYEPELALRGGEDGLDFYRRFSKELKRYLVPGGTAAFEVGEGQALRVRAMLDAALPGAESTIHKDLNGIDRVVSTRI